MAHSSVELAGMYEWMRGLAAKYDVKIITAQAPRITTSSMPQNEDGIIIIDYIGMISTQVKE